MVYRYPLYLRATAYVLFKVGKKDPDKNDGLQLVVGCWNEQVETLVIYRISWYESLGESECIRMFSFDPQLEFDGIGARFYRKYKVEKGYYLYIFF